MREGPGSRRSNPLTVSMARVRVDGAMSDVARRFLLDAAARFRHSHRRRQDVARRPLARWARALAAVRADLARRPRDRNLGRRDAVAALLRRVAGLRQVRGAAQAARRSGQVRRLRRRGDERGATSSASASAGRPATSRPRTAPGRRGPSGASAAAALRMPRRLRASTPTAVVDLEDEDLELDGWDRDESNVAVTRAEDLDDAVARALDAEQRRCDRTWPVERAAALPGRRRAT